MSTALRRSLSAGLIALTAGLLAFSQNQDDPLRPRPPEVGDKAPDFKAKTISGKEIQLHESFKGRLVLLDFWATWCPPCRREIPHLKAAYEKYHEKGLVIVGLSRDDLHQIPPERVSEFVEEHEMKWEQVYDGAPEIAAAYAVKGIPSPFLVDGDTGELLAANADLRGDALTRTLEKHIAAKIKRVKEKAAGATP